MRDDQHTNASGDRYRDTHYARADHRCTGSGIEARAVCRVRARSAPAAPAPATGGNCGGGVNAGPNTSCAFAQNVAAAYNGPGGGTEYVYSPASGQSYWMTYIQSTGNRVYATGGNNASVYFTY